jgi:hypothetical protein
MSLDVCTTTKITPPLLIMTVQILMPAPRYLPTTTNASPARPHDGSSLGARTKNSHDDETPERLKPPSYAYQSDRDLSTRSDLIERVRALGQESPEVQQYADETVKCLEYGCYRAAIVMCWNILMCILYCKIESYGLSTFARIAKERGVKFTGRLVSMHDLNKLTDSNIIEASHSIGIFDRNVKQQLIQLASTRGGCAHVTQLAVDERRAEIFVSDVLSYSTLVRGSTITKGFIVQSILTYPNQAIIRNHVRMMVGSRRFWPLLVAILDEIEQAKYDQLSGMENYFTYIRVTMEFLTMTKRRIRPFSILHERYFLRGKYPARSRLHPLLKELLRNNSVRRYAVRKQLLAPYILDLASSGSYDEAGERASVMALFGADLTQEQLNKVAEAVAMEDQVFGSRSAESALKQLVQYRSRELSTINTDKLKAVGWIT